MADENKKITDYPFDTLDKYVQILSGIEKMYLKEKIDEISSKYNSLIELKKTKKSAQEIDRMFFCFENLPPTGKEYWFMTYGATKPEDKRQLLIMFGHTSESIKINHKEIINRKCEGRNGYITVWGYTDRKNLILEDECSISINSDGLMVSARQNKVNVRYNGKFPDYSFILSKRNKEIANFKITRAEDNSKSFEFNNYFKLFAGFALINLYFDFTGTLNGENFTGKCYVQKVVVIGPFVPWYWGRIVFSNGSVLTYFEPRIEILIFEHKIRSILEFYDKTKDKKYIFKNLNIKKSGKKNREWLITANEGKVFISLKAYASHKFIFEKIGMFTYIEYLCEVTDISMEGLDIDTNNLGSGFGLIEDATGYIL